MLTQRINCEEEFDVVGDTDNVDTMLAIVEEHQPDLLFADLKLANPIDTDVFQEISRVSPDTRTCVWTSEPTSPIAYTVLGWGAAGILSKQISGDSVITALRTVAHGYTIFPQAHLDEFTVLRRNVAKSGNIFGLSKRELEVLEASAKGLCTGQIADQLQISGRTVETHRSSIYRKTDSRNLKRVDHFLQSQGHDSESMM